MSDEPTRVRISYTVNLDEVPQRIAALMHEAQSGMKELPLLLETSAKDLGDKNNITGAIGTINKIRSALMDVDLRLEDCSALLANYQSTQVELAYAERQAEEELNEAVEEE